MRQFKGIGGGVATGWGSGGAVQGYKVEGMRLVMRKGRGRGLVDGDVEGGGEISGGGEATRGERGRKRGKRGEGGEGKWERE